MAVEWDVLVMDLDGTLLCKKGEGSNANLYALDQLRACGVEVVVATGRCYAECKHILKQIDHRGVCITASGSQLTDADGGAIMKNGVDINVVRAAAGKIIDSGHRCLILKDQSETGTPYLLVGDAPLHSASVWWFDALNISLQEVDVIDEDPWPDHTLRVGAVAEGKHLHSIATELEIELCGKAKLQHWSAVTSAEATGSSIHLLEVFGKSVNKWSMLQKYLGDKLNVSSVAAIGDGLNDIEVLAEAGLSIVMSNANDDVRQHADVLAGHHDEDGFAYAMNRWIIPVSGKI